jgi:hypothetical protein
MSVNSGGKMRRQALFLVGTYKTEKVIQGAKGHGE